MKRAFIAKLSLQRISIKRGSNNCWVILMFHNAIPRQCFLTFMSTVVAYMVPNKSSKLFSENTAVAYSGQACPLCLFISHLNH